MKQENNKLIPESFYQTGNTESGKNHRGLFAALIVIVILLVGVVSIMGILNIQLFRKVMELSPEEYVFQVTRISETSATQPTEAEALKETAGDPLQIQLVQAPQAIANVPQAGGLSLQDIYNQNIGSVVSISTGSGSGSGVVISKCGYILTNQHVLGGNQTARVLFHDGTELPARIVGTDPVSDLAVLDVEAEDLTPVSFGSDEQLQVGDCVVAIGDPLGVALRGTMTNGIISAINRNMEIDGRTVHLIQTNAALNAGNSGGPLLNCYGQVIGINTMKISKFSDKSDVEGIGFAIPSSTVKEVVDQLLRDGYVSSHPDLGFRVEKVSAFDQLYYRVPAGLFITELTQKNLPVQPGDILVRFAGHRIGDTESLEQYLHQYKAGDSVIITIYRDGRQYELAITLTKEK